MKQRKPDRFKPFLRLFPVFLLLLLCGCISNNHWVWQNPEKQGELLLLKDKKICRELARTEVAQINYYYNFYDIDYLYDYPFYPYYRDRYRRPFFHGYHHYRFMQQQDDLEHFFRVCMKAKGWYRVKIKPEAK